MTIKYYIDGLPMEEVLANQKKNQEIVEALGGCWHDYNGATESCRKCKEIFGATLYPVNPDFTSDAGKIQLLREMKKIRPYAIAEFLYQIDTEMDAEDFILGYLTDPDNCVLRDKAWEFLCGLKERIDK